MSPSCRSSATWESPSAGDALPETAGRTGLPQRSPKGKSRASPSARPSTTSSGSPATSWPGTRAANTRPTGSAASRKPAGEVLAADFPVSFDGMAQPVQAGRIRLFGGLRSDPFFADVEGALHGFARTGHDDFAGNNVDSIVLEVPDDMLGGPVIGVWASISRRSNGVLELMDRGGNPTINPFINPDGEKNLFNSREPADDVANYLEPWSAILQNAGGYTPQQARAAALQVLPDILHYDRTKPATYPNGRVLTDDVYNLRFAWLTNGKVPPSGLKPHDNLLTEFPYLGVLNPLKTSSGSERMRRAAGREGNGGHP